MEIPNLKTTWKKLFPLLKFKKSTTTCKLAWSMLNPLFFQPKLILAVLNLTFQHGTFQTHSILSWPFWIGRFGPWHIPAMLILTFLPSGKWLFLIVPGLRTIYFFFALFFSLLSDNFLYFFLTFGSESWFELPFGPGWFAKKFIFSHEYLKSATIIDWLTHV
jgi:hypothetical protein